MSVITVQVGQCGNQIGQQLFKTLMSDCQDVKIPKSSNATNFPSDQKEFKRINEDYVNESLRRYFIQNNKGQIFARSILIDMESKVVNSMLYNKTQESANHLAWSFREENSYTQKQGSGNNWTYGYCVNGPNSRNKIEEILRREVERTDRLDCFLICMSMAGGTGSGVGSYYTELIRDFYPRTSIVNNCVWPFSNGEVIIQNYNFLLTLNKLYANSNGIILMENDILHNICLRLNNYGKNEISFSDLNEVIAHKLGSILQPCFNRSFGVERNHLNEIVSDLCSINEFKLLSLNNIPMLSKQAIEFSTFNWNGLYKTAKQLLFTGGYMDEALNWQNTNINHKTLSLSVFARGFQSNFIQHQEMIQKNFDKNYMNKHFSSCLSELWIEPVKLWHANRSFNNYEKSLSLLSNSQLPALKVDKLIEKAWSMFTSKAYVHQYLKYENFEDEDFLNSFLFAEQMVKNYKRL
jgi:tubulin delta